MTARTTAGSTLRISAGIPATFDPAGYAALTYTKLGEVTNLGDYGREYALVTHQPIDTRGDVKLKGGFNEGSIDLELALDPADAGQIIAKAAVNSDNAYAFKLTMQSGTIRYFQALVMSTKEKPGSRDNVMGYSIKLELTSSSTGVGIVEA
jgi:hypothetical protein